MPSGWADEPYAIVRQLANVNGATLVLVSLPRGYAILSNCQGGEVEMLYALGPDLDLDWVCRSCVDFERSLQLSPTAVGAPPQELCTKQASAMINKPVDGRSAFTNPLRHRALIESDD
jgi:hypothetical protein